MHLMKPLFDVRWRFSYNDGTADKYGMWTLATKNIKEMACFQKTNNLARAFVERKCKRTGKVEVLVSCTGQDYCIFKWEQAVKGAYGAIGKMTGQTIGLSLFSRDFQATVYVDGRKPVIVKRQQDERNLNYEGYGK